MQQNLSASCILSDVDYQCWRGAAAALSGLSALGRAGRIPSEESRGQPQRSVFGDRPGKFLLQDLRRLQARQHDAGCIIFNYYEGAPGEVPHARLRHGAELRRAALRPLEALLRQGSLGQAEAQRGWASVVLSCCRRSVIVQRGVLGH